MSAALRARCESVCDACKEKFAEMYHDTDMTFECEHLKNGRFCETIMQANERRKSLETSKMNVRMAEIVNPWEGTRGGDALAMMASLNKNELLDIIKIYDYILHQSCVIRTYIQLLQKDAEFQGYTVKVRCVDRI